MNRLQKAIINGTDKDTNIKSIEQRNADAQVVNNLADIQSDEQRAKTINPDTYLKIIESQKIAQESVNKSKFVYRLTIAPNIKQRQKYTNAFVYLKKIIAKINDNIKSNKYKEKIRDAHYFYFNYQKDLSADDKKAFNEYIDKVNATKTDASKYVSNITINLSNIFNFQDLLDKKFDLLNDKINERAEQKAEQEQKANA